MSAIFDIDVVKLHVKNSSQFTNQVIEADIRIVVTKDGQTVRIPMMFRLGVPTPEGFTAYESITKEQFLGWMEADGPQLNHLKSHCERVLDRQIEESAMRKLDAPWNSRAVEQY